MAPVNRATLLGRIQKVLKKHYKPVAVPTGRPVLEYLMLAAVRENSPPDVAERVVASLLDKFFDLNELRVSSVRELTEEMKPLADSEASAIRLKSILQSVFETHYAFDIDHLKKQNLGAALKTLGRYEGTNEYSLAFVTQHGLGGHSIPVNKGAMLALVVVGVLTEKEAGSGKVPGMERAIPKTKGIEFASLLHQMGVLVAANPYSPAVRKLLLEIAPNCKDRLPKRPSKKPAPVKEKPAKAKAASRRKSEAAEKTKPAAKRKKTAGKKVAATKKPTGSRKKASTKGAAKKSAAKKPSRSKAAKKRVKKVGSKKKSTTKKLSKRKPR